MFSRHKIPALSLILLVVLLAVAGCSGKGSESGSAAQDGKTPSGSPKEVMTQITTEPITIRMYHVASSISDQEFKDYFVDPVAKKYPNITMELVRMKDKGNAPAELLSSNSFPDIIYDAPVYVPDMINLGIVEDLTPLIKKNGVELDRFQKTVRNGGMTGFQPDPNKLVSLPFSLNLSVLAYNKDLFNKFGVPYPKDGMSWDDAIALGKRLTRTEDGIAYIGIDPWRVDAIGGELSLPNYNPDTKKAAFNTEGWATALRLFKEAMDIPGFVSGNKYNYNFFTDNLAMYPVWMNDFASKLTEPDVAKARNNFDFVTYPYVKGYEGIGQNLGFSQLLLSNLSKHKDEALAVIQVALSDEVQIKMARAGRASPLADEKFKTNYLKDNPLFDGKNIASAFKVTPAPFAPFSKYDNDLLQIYRGAKKELALNHKDVNTVLRELQEKADQFIADNP